MFNANNSSMNSKYIDTPIYAKMEMALNFNLRVVQEYFEPKIQRTLRIFINMGQKNNFLRQKKSALRHLRG